MGSAACKALPLPWHRSQANQICRGNNSSDSGSNACTMHFTSHGCHPTQDVPSTLPRPPSLPRLSQSPTSTTAAPPFARRSFSCDEIGVTGQNEIYATHPCSLPPIQSQRSDRLQVVTVRTPGHTSIVPCTTAQDTCAARHIITPESVSFTVSAQGLSPNTTPYTCSHTLSVDGAGHQTQSESAATRELADTAPLPDDVAEGGDDVFSLCSGSSNSQTAAAFPLLAMTRCVRGAESTQTPPQPSPPSVTWARSGGAAAATVQTPLLQSLQGQPDDTIGDGATRADPEAVLTAVQSGSVLTAQPPPNTHGFARSLLDCSFDSRALGDPSTGPAAAERLARRAGSPSQHEYVRDGTVDTAAARSERQLSVLEFVNFFNGLANEAGTGGASRATSLRWFRVCDESQQVQRARPSHRTRSETRIRWAPYEYYEDDPHTPGYPYSTASSHSSNGDDEKVNGNTIDHNGRNDTDTISRLSDANAGMPLREMRRHHGDDGSSPLQPFVFCRDNNIVATPNIGDASLCVDINKEEPKKLSSSQPVRRCSVVSLHPCGTWRRHHVVPIFVDHSPAVAPLGRSGDEAHKGQPVKREKVNDPLLEDLVRDESDLSFSCTSSSCPQLSSGAESGSLKPSPSFDAGEQEGHGVQFNVIVPSSAPAPYLSVVLPSVAADNTDGNPFCCSDEHPPRRRAASDSSSCAVMQQEQLQRLRDMATTRPAPSKPQKPIISDDVPFRQQLAKRASQDYELFMLLRRKGDVALLKQIE